MDHQKRCNTSKWFALASENQANPMSGAKHVKNWTSQVCPVHARLSPKTNSWSASWNMIQQRTHDVEPRWASDSWPTRADHLESQRPPLGDCLPATHFDFCVVEVREPHGELSHLLSRGRSSLPFVATLPLRQLLELCSHVICFGPDLHGKTGKQPFIAVDVPHWNAPLQPRSRFLAHTDVTRMKKLSWTTCPRQTLRRMASQVDDSCGWPKQPSKP